MLYFCISSLCETPVQHTLWYTCYKHEHTAACTRHKYILYIIEQDLSYKESHGSLNYWISVQPLSELADTAASVGWPCQPVLCIEFLLQLIRCDGERWLCERCSRIHFPSLCCLLFDHPCKQPVPGTWNMIVMHTATESTAIVV